MHLRIAAFLDPRFKDLSPIVPTLEHGCVYENTKVDLHLQKLNQMMMNQQKQMEKYPGGRKVTY